MSYFFKIAQQVLGLYTDVHKQAIYKHKIWYLGPSSFHKQLYDNCLLQCSAYHHKIKGWFWLK